MVMQGARVRLPEARAPHPSKVLKIFHDTSSSSLAFMLSDSSCLLFATTSPFQHPGAPSSAAEAAPPAAVPGPISDACFLRLRSAESRPCAAVAFLAAMPQRHGGSGSATTTTTTAIVSCLRTATKFTPISIQIKGHQQITDATNRVHALGHLDLPHGFGVRIAASINVVVVYSPAARKIVVLAAKIKEGSKGLVNSHINLIKCCELSPDWPVYGISLSAQHLILGVENGVRVWILRSLVRGKEHRVSKVSNTGGKSLGRSGKSFKNSAVECKVKMSYVARQVESVLECNGKDVGRDFQKKNHVGKTNVDDPVNRQKEIKFVSRNGGKDDVDDSECGVKECECEVKFKDAGSQNSAGVSFVHCNGHSLNCEKKHRYETVVVDAQKNGASDCTVVAVVSTDSRKNAISDCSVNNATGVNCTAKVPELKLSLLKNGLISDGRATSEDSFARHSLSQLSSGSLPFSPETASSGSIPISVHSMTSTTSSTQITSTIDNSQAAVDRNCKGKLSVRTEIAQKEMSVFVAFQSLNGKSTISNKLSKKPPRAISIHAFGLTEFVVLDSVGDLHILTLGKPSGQDNKNGCDDNFAANYSLRRLACTMKVKALSVYSQINSSTKKVLISDGHYTIHLIQLSETDPSISKNDERPNVEQHLQLSVAQAMLMTEHVHAISMMSENTFLILTQGSINTYLTFGS